MCRAGGLEAGCGARAGQGGSGGGRKACMELLLVRLRFHPGWPLAAAQAGLTVRNLEQGRRWDKGGPGQRGHRLYETFFSSEGTLSNLGVTLECRLPDGRSLLRRTASVSWALTRTEPGSQVRAT